MRNIRRVVIALVLAGLLSTVLILPAFASGAGSSGKAEHGVECEGKGTY